MGVQNASKQQEGHIRILITVNEVGMADRKQDLLSCCN